MGQGSTPKLRVYGENYAQKRIIKEGLKTDKDNIICCVSAYHGQRFMFNKYKLFYSQLIHTVLFFSVHQSCVDVCACVCVTVCVCVHTSAHNCDHANAGLHASQVCVCINIYANMETLEMTRSTISQ